MRLEGERDACEGRGEFLARAGVIGALEFLRHPCVADAVIGADGVEHVEHARHTIDERDVDGFNLRPEGKSAVGDDEGVGVADAGEQGKNVRVQDAGFEHGIFAPCSAYNDAMGALPQLRVIHTVCSHDCPDSCAVLVTVNEEGRAVKVEGDPSQPVTRGFLCGKVAKYLDRVYAPDRVLYPLERKARLEKGPAAARARARSF